MTFADHLPRIREAMEGFPVLDTHTSGTSIDPAEIYFPKSHAAALDPDRALVIGNRGMGKSFWANALIQDDTRRKIAETFPEARLDRGEIGVHFGFADAEGATGGVSRDELDLHLDAGVPVEMIWRAVTLPPVAALTGREVPSRLPERLAWVRNEPAEVRDALRAADQVLAARSGRLIFVFDQLEQLSGDFDRRRKLSQGILRLALAYKSYRGLRIKTFMRPDQFSDDRLFDFPDASKISGEAVTLDWRAHDLYGLLYARLRRSVRESFDAVAMAAGIDMSSIEPRVDLPRSLVMDEDAQRVVFEYIAGPYMGANVKRGRPYSWLVLHLADARNQVSPRTFLRALRYAAAHSPQPDRTAIDHHGIAEGVRQASANRVDDLKEDYPWIPPALLALKRLLVPCDPAEMFQLWREGKTLDRLKEHTSSDKTPAWLAAASDGDNGSLERLLSAMVDVGVVERRLTTGKVDVPDIFRLPADIRRKGGVTPQQRRQVRVR